MPRFGNPKESDGQAASGNMSAANNTGRNTGFHLALSHGLETVRGMPHVPGLRSCYAKVGRLVYFGRMLDKIRVQAAGRLPAEYQPNLGAGFDRRCCGFL